MEELEKIKAEIEKENTEHEQRIKDLMAKLEEPKEPEYKRWRAKKGERYFCIDAVGCIQTEVDGKYIQDDCGYRLGNHFETEAEAELCKQKLIAYQTIKDDTKGFKPDWGNENQYKYYVEYEHSFDELMTNCDIFRQNLTIYFETEEDAQASINKHKKEWKILLDVKEERKNNGQRQDNSANI